MASTLVLIRGIPGSGKSTLAKAMPGFFHVEADMYFVDDSGNYRFGGERLREAHACCIGTRVCCSRRQVIEDEVASWRHIAVQGWNDKPARWRWRWLKRHVLLRAVRVEIVEVPE